MGSTPVLNETPLPSAAYNALPHIDDIRTIAHSHLDARGALLKVIAAHSLQDIFSIHLAHKHFDLPEGRVIVYETIVGQNCPTFQISSPRDPAKCDNLHGIYFRAVEEGKMAAYEYTTDAVKADASDYHVFLGAFARIAIEHKVQDIFALTLKSLNNAQVMHEFEMPDLSSTILVHDASWVPQAESSVSTDWGFSDPGQSGARSVNTMTRCTFTRSNHHYEITKYDPDERLCTQDGDIMTSVRRIGGRGGTHTEYPTKRHTAAEKVGLMINGEILLPGTEAFQLVNYARQTIAAY